MQGQGAWAAVLGALPGGIAAMVAQGLNPEGNIVVGVLLVLALWAVVASAVLRSRWVMAMSPQQRRDLWIPSPWQSRLLQLIAGLLVLGLAGVVAQVAIGTAQVYDPWLAIALGGMAVCAWGLSRLAMTLRQLSGE